MADVVLRKGDAENCDAVVVSVNIEDDEIQLIALDLEYEVSEDPYETAHLMFPEDGDPICHCQSGNYVEYQCSGHNDPLAAPCHCRLVDAQAARNDVVSKNPVTISAADPVGGLSGPLSVSVYKGIELYGLKGVCSTDGLVRREYDGTLWYYYFNDNGISRDTWSIDGINAWAGGSPVELRVYGGSLPGSVPSVPLRASKTFEIIEAYAKQEDGHQVGSVSMSPTSSGEWLGSPNPTGHFERGTQVTISASVSDGYERCYEFDYWSIEGGSPDSNFDIYEQTITIEARPFNHLHNPQTRKFEARFKRKSWPLTASASPPDGGTVDVSSDRIDCVREQYLYAYEDNKCYNFEKWVIDGVEYTDRFVTVDPSRISSLENLSAIAYFSKKTYHVVGDRPVFDVSSGKIIYGMNGLPIFGNCSEDS